jgi:hypothetical protein
MNDLLPSINLINALLHCIEIYRFGWFYIAECNGGQNFNVPEGTTWSVVSEVIRNLKDRKHIAIVAVVEGDGNVQDSITIADIDEVLSKFLELKLT